MIDLSKDPLIQTLKQSLLLLDEAERRKDILTPLKRAVCNCMEMSLKIQDDKELIRISTGLMLLSSLVDELPELLNDDASQLRCINLLRKGILNGLEAYHGPKRH